MGERDEWVADALNDRDDQAAWEAMRNLDLGLEPGCVTTDAMQARWAADRAEVEAEWAARQAVEYGRLRWVAQLALDREAEREAAA